MAAESENGAAEKQAKPASHGEAEFAAKPVEPAATPAEPTATPMQPAAKPDELTAKPVEQAAKPDEPAAEAEPPAPQPSPATCQGIAISQEAFEEAVLRGEFDDTDYLYYLEPAGVLQADLVCAHRYPAENIRAGILMTRTARDTKTVYFDDGINPDTYELSFPKEFGYVKSIQHYQPQTREHAKYPWSKKY